MLEDFERDVKKVNGKVNDVLKQTYDLGQLNTVNALIEYCEHFKVDVVPINVLVDVKDKIESEMK